MQITVPLPAAWCSPGGQLREASTFGTDTLMFKSQHVRVVRVETPFVQSVQVVLKLSYV